MTFGGFLRWRLSEVGLPPSNGPIPLWVLAELTYACPLQCPYCSNPVDFARYKDALTTDEWLNVLRQARALGAAQLGFSGGEPLVRSDLDTLVEEARRLGYYTNLITSGIGMDETRLKALKDAGLDHIQISFQASSEELNDFLGAAKSFAHKTSVARLIKDYGYPMVLNVVIHRRNIDHIEQILEMAIALDADYVELASTQFYGWALFNRDQLLPSREQVSRAEAIAHQYQARLAGRMKIYYVVPDFHEERPKACMNGWGQVFLTIAPDGAALPCQAARQLPGLSFPNVKEHSIEWIWRESPAFRRFRDFDWMKEPCRSCSERFKEFGGCRCQAFQLTGDPSATDPVCSRSPHHQLVLGAVDTANRAARLSSAQMQPLIFRNSRNSKALAG